MRYLNLAWILLFCSCYTQQPISSAPPQNNGTYKVEYLFEHEGCKIYRFYDMGHYVYFTNCNGEAISYADSTVTKNAIRRTK